MKLIPWDQRQPGDIGFVRYSGLFPDLTSDFEAEIHQDYKGGFIPSHAFIVTKGDMVIEAALSWTENSAAAINPISEYTTLPTQLWRIERTPEQIEFALNSIVQQFAHDGYGLLNLFGFAIEAVRRHLGNPKAGNALFAGYVCSMTALIFLRYPASETWPLKVELRDCDPLQLLMWCLENQLQE